MACIQDLFSDVAKQNPDAPALCLEEDNSIVTYGQLDSVSDRIAAALQQCGVVTGSLVCLYTDRSVGLIASMLGVLKCGAAYVPVDKSFPKDRQEYMRADSRAPVIITDDITQQGPGVLLINRHGEILQGSSAVFMPSTPAAVASSADDLAYVLYTSGSTGKPKGVMVEHRGVVNVLRYFAELLRLAPSERVLGLTTTCFDISVLEIFMPLTHGATLFLVSSTTQKDPYRLMEILSHEHISVMQATPATFELLMSAGWEGIPNLRVLCGGEAFRLNLAPLTMKCHTFYNVYGPTETTIWSTCYAFMKYEGAPIETLPLGQAIWNTDLRIVVGEEEAAVGQEGELWIGGDGVTRGYWNRPELTAEKFPVVEGKRWYKTGDIVKRDSDGALRYIGRADNQVKINGYRIELGEIEKILQLAEGVQTAVVVASENTRTGRALVAYYKPKKASTVATASLKAALSRSLPPYMIPRYFVPLQEFTYTPNGKIDRNALPAPSGNMTSNDGQAHTAVCINDIDASSPGGGLTDHICSALAEICGVEVAADTNFASLVDSMSSAVAAPQLSIALWDFPMRHLDFLQPGMNANVLCDRLRKWLQINKPHVLANFPMESTPLPPPAPKPSLTTKTKPDYETPLDLSLRGLRGLLILWVVIDHTQRHWGVGRGRWYILNTAFFVFLTGFGLHMQYVKAKGKIEWKNFFYTRAVALFPLYYLALIMWLPYYIYLRVKPESSKHFPEYKERPMLSYMHDAVWYLSGMQSLYYKMQLKIYPIYYASSLWILYILYYLTLRFKDLLPRNYRPKSWPVIIILIVHLGPFITQLCGENGPVLYYPFLLSGMATAAIFLRFLSKASTSTFPRYIPDLLFLGLCFMISLYRSQIHALDVLLASVVVPLTFAAFLFSIARHCADPDAPPSFVRKYLLETRPIVALGDLSYPIYLFHLVIMTYYLKMGVEEWPTIYPPATIPYRDIFRIVFYVEKCGFMLRLIAFGAVVTFCWFMKNIVQDTYLIPWLVKLRIKTKNAKLAHSPVTCSFGGWWAQAASADRDSTRSSSTECMELDMMSEHGNSNSNSY